MPNEIRIITDPFDNRIFLLQGICNTINGNRSEIYDDASMVIQKPAICVEVKQGGHHELFYFRSVSWNHTMLITVSNRNNRWEASQSEKDPSKETLAAILKRGSQLI